MRRACVCPCVCPSRSYILSKRINISSIFFHRRVATPFLFFHTKRHGNIPTGLPPSGGAIYSTSARLTVHSKPGRSAVNGTYVLVTISRSVHVRDFIISVRARKITTFVAYLPCIRMLNYIVSNSN